MLSFYRAIRPRAGRVCAHAVCAIRASRLPIHVLVRAQVQCGSFLQVVVVVSSEAKQR